MELARGQRVKLADLGIDIRPFALEVSLGGNLSIDVACFGLDADKRLSDERYMTFFNQPASPCGAVKLASPGKFEFNLGALPASIHSLTITLAIDGAGQMNALGRSSAVIKMHGELVARHEFDGAQFAAERALMLLELYRKDGVWRMCAVGQGFNGGLDALVTHFGGTVAAPAAAPTTTAPPASPPPTPKVSLSKITLEKKGQKVSLEKKSSAGHGRIVCNLNWSASPQAGQSKGFLGGIFGGGAKKIDLDLGCLIEMANGQVTAVQALGDTFGSFDYPPYVQLAGDDRTGASAAGEFMYINGDHLKDLRRICVYAFIYEGVPNWSQADGVVTISVPGHPPVEVRLDSHENGKGMCAIAMLENDGGQLRVTKLVEYFGGHQALDQRYGWGLQWVAGSKD